MTLLWGRLVEVFRSEKYFFLREKLIQLSLTRALINNKKKRISTWLLLPHLDLIYFCDMTEWLQAKRRLLPRTQVFPIHTISCHTKNSTKPAGLYLSSKSMSFILIQSHFALILRYNCWRSTVLFASGNKWKKSLTLISAQLDHDR